MDVRFTSDEYVTGTGFTLDIRSTLCKVVIVAGEFLQGALVTDTDTGGNYPNNACQNWTIIADENQVYLVCKTNIPSI